MQCHIVVLHVHSKQSHGMAVLQPLHACRLNFVMIFSVFSAECQYLSVSRGGWSVSAGA
jgi:hypothetical protein